MGSCLNHHSSVKPFQGYQDAPINLQKGFDHLENSVILAK